MVIIWHVVLRLLFFYVDIFVLLLCIEFLHCHWFEFSVLELVYNIIFKIAHFNNTVYYGILFWVHYEIVLCKQCFMLFYIYSSLRNFNLFFVNVQLEFYWIDRFNFLINEIFLLVDCVLIYLEVKLIFVVVFFCFHDSLSVA